jgi:hypothetical protein
MGVYLPAALCARSTRILYQAQAQEAGSPAQECTFASSGIRGIREWEGTLVGSHELPSLTVLFILFTRQNYRKALLCFR